MSTRYIPTEAHRALLRETFNKNQPWIRSARIRRVQAIIRRLNDCPPLEAYLRADLLNAAANVPLLVEKPKEPTNGSE